MNLVDCHNHTKYSFDGKDTVKDMIESAIDKGISIFSITDHADVNYYEQNIEENIKKSVSKINTFKEQYKNIKLISGVELGQALLDEERAQKILSIDSIDFVIGSIHNLKDMEDFYFFDYSVIADEEITDIMRNYYIELYNLAKWNQYDTMAHITYPYRYMTFEKAKRKIELDISKFDEIVYEIYKVLIQNGKAMELNTSKRFIESQAERDMITRYLKMYYQLGGIQVTTGSDSHNVNDVGRGITKAYEVLKNIGFQYVTYFEKRKPVMVKI